MFQLWAFCSFSFNIEESQDFKKEVRGPEESSTLEGSLRVETGPRREKQSKFLMDSRHHIGVYNQKSVQKGKKREHLQKSATNALITIEIMLI